MSDINRQNKYMTFRISMTEKPKSLTFFINDSYMLCNRRIVNHLCYIYTLTIFRQFIGQ